MLRFHVSNRWERHDFEHTEGPIEFGRNPANGEVPRFVIQDLSVSRDHVRVEEQATRQVRVENLSKKNPVTCGDGSVLAPGKFREFAPPFRLTLGKTLIDVEPCPAAGETLAHGPANGNGHKNGNGHGSAQEEPLATIAFPVRAANLGDVRQSIMNLGNSPSPEVLAHWFETVIAVQRAAAGSPEFYDQTAQAVVNLVGLDTGIVLLKRGPNWETAASFPKGGNRRFSRNVLQRVSDQKRTFYQTSLPAEASSSLQELEAVVASPILDPTDQVVGAVYGLCACNAGRPQEFGIGPLEAQLVQLLASAAGAGLVRLEHEAENARLRVQFEQFFTEKLARELQRNPRLLEGQEREITVLFSDIRGFSRFTERLGPHDTCRLVADVQERISGKAREFDGVVVDYYGDGLCAMWNAPAEQPDHAVLACRAALAMLAELPAMTAEWGPLLGEPLQIGVGLNTGPALVGNTGSKHKFKYGPFGHTVNLASRVEGATKHLGVPALITGSTRAKLNGTFALRRLGRTRLVGIKGPIELYELNGETASAPWLAQREAFEKALHLHEAGKWAEACRALDPVLAGGHGQYDYASLDLLMRAVACLKSPPETFDPVLELTRK